MNKSQDNLMRFQEIANRGLQDRLDPDKRARFDEAVKRSLVKVSSNSNITPDNSPEESFTDKLLIGIGDGMTRFGAGVKQRFQEANQDALEGRVSSLDHAHKSVVSDAESRLKEQSSELTESNQQEIERREFFDNTPVGQTNTAKVGSFVGEVAPSLIIPGGAQRAVGARVMGNAASGGAASLAQFDETGDQTKGNVIAGSAIGAAIPYGGGKIVKAIGDKVESRAITKALDKASPGSEDLKSASSKAYDAVDESGVRIASDSISSMVDKAEAVVKKEGFNRRMHPKVKIALDELRENSARNLSMSELDTLRKVTRDAAGSLDPGEARLGSMIIDEIDNLVDTIPSDQLIGSSSVDVSSKIKEARSLWGRAKRTEIVEDAVERAKSQASGLENGLRVQFKQILHNKKLVRGFSQDERDAMRLIVRGSKAANISKALGKFGFTEGQATSMLLGSLGVAGGAAVGGVGGAVAIPAIGQAFKNQAQRLTAKNTKLAQQLISSGPKARSIATAYIRSVPKGKRSPEDLAALLVNQSAEGLDAMVKSKNEMLSNAAFYASSVLNYDSRVDSVED